MKRKVCVVVTARPSYSRVRTLLRAIRDRDDLELQLVVAASALLDRYGATQKTIEKEGYKVDRRVFMILEGENLVTSAKSTGLGVVELATVLDDLRPDVVVTIADRFETMATAIAASYLHIPLAHVQGGEITGSIDEKVRHAITKLADLHFVASEGAARRVRQMGERADTVHVTGCPSIDLAMEALGQTDEFRVFDRYQGVGPKLDLDDGFIVVLQHPVTTEYDQSRRNIEETLHAIHELDLPTLWFWPNVDAGSDGTSNGIRAFRERVAPKNIHFFKSLAPDDFIRLLDQSDCIVGNSSVGIRECSFLGLPAVNIGPRQAGRDRGRNVTDVGYARREIVDAVCAARANGRLDADHVYGGGSAGERMAEILATAPLSVEKRLQL